MTNVIAKLFVVIHLSKVKLTLFLDGNCFLIASTDSVYTILQMLLSLLEDGCTNMLRNALYDHCRLMFDLALHGILAENGPNMI